MMAFNAFKPGRWSLFLGIAAAKTAVLAALLLLITSSAPEADAPQPAAATAIGGVATGPWRVVLDHPGGGLPFTLEIVATPDGGATAFFITGPERMEAEKTVIEDGRLTIEMPSYDSVLTATVQPDGTLAGEAVLTRRLGTLQTIPFALTATHGQSWRFFPEQDPDPVQVGGTWSIALTGPDGSVMRDGLGIFEQDGPYVTGTVIFPTGDYRFLSGEVMNGELLLSTFDGGQGTVWRGTLQPDGTLQGNFFAKSYGFPPLPWTGTPDPDAALPDAYSHTYLKDGYDRFSVAFPNLDGQMVSLDDPRFQGKVVLVTIGGTWCPTCHDEAAFLAPYYEANKDRGLEVVGIQFEYTDDLERSRRQIERFKARYGIGYDMLFAGAFGQQSVAEALPMLNGIKAYPTTLFIDRKGEVRRIHTSFPGAAAGVKHRKYLEEFQSFVDDLLDEAAI